MQATNIHSQWRCINTVPERPTHDTVMNRPFEMIGCIGSIDHHPSEDSIRLGSGFHSVRLTCGRLGALSKQQQKGVAKSSDVCKLEAPSSWCCNLVKYNIGSTGCAEAHRNVSWLGGG